MIFLYLTLKKKWFDAIESGEKTVEYRRWKCYWERRLLDESGEFRKFDKIIFRNGYGKNIPTIEADFVSIEQTWCPIDLNWGKYQLCFAINFKNAKRVK